MIDDDRRRLYGRPAATAEPVPVLAPPVPPPPELEPAPAPEPAREDETEEPATGPSVGDASPASPRRRRLIPIAAVAVVAIVGVGVVGTVMVAAAPSGEPVLAVFDREPSSAERDAEQRAGRDGAGIGSVDALQVRRILQYGDDGGTEREIWAVRFDASGFGGSSSFVVCLTTEPTGMSSGPLACMEEHDIARRGFIPLDQPRPSVVVDGERRVVEWGPRGDARLIDPPTPPRDDARS